MIKTIVFSFVNVCRKTTFRYFDTFLIELIEFKTDLSNKKRIQILGTQLSKQKSKLMFGRIKISFIRWNKIYFIINYSPY